jgi:hypothetical protein
MGGVMSDIVTGLIGMGLMFAFLLAIAIKLNEFPLWVVFAIGVAGMIGGFLSDAVFPLLRRPRSE